MERNVESSRRNGSEIRKWKQTWKETWKVAESVEASVESSELARLLLKSTRIHATRATRGDHQSAGRESPACSHVVLALRSVSAASTCQPIRHIRRPRSPAPSLFYAPRSVSAASISLQPSTISVKPSTTNHPPHSRGPSPPRLPTQNRIPSIQESSFGNTPPPCPTPRTTDRTPVPSP